MNITAWSQNMIDLWRDLANWRKAALPGHQRRLCVVDPDLHRGCFPGEWVYWGGQAYTYRSWRTWRDLAERLSCRLLTPHPLEAPLLMLTFEALDMRDSWHEEQGDDKYGVNAPYARTHKLENPGFLADYLWALETVAPPRNAHILDLGVNRADSFIPLATCFPEHHHSFKLTGVDLSPSAIAEARRRFPEAELIEDDFRHFQQWSLPPVDLLISIGSLQSSGLDGKTLFAAIAKHLLAPQAAVILGFPNVRYANGELMYGAVPKGGRRTEHSLWIKDALYYRKLLQKRGMRTHLTGRDYLFLVAESPRRGP